MPAGQRSRLLGKDWRASADRAWTTSSDAQGFHILTADKNDGYSWKTAASLSKPGFDADAWIGNACITASGKHAVAVYTPRTFTNKPELMTRGAFTAIVDLTTGKVTKLPVQSSLAYFSPGCGQGETAVVSQFTDDSAKQSGTRLVTVDAQAGKAGKVGKPLKLQGQVTSAVPYRDGIATAAGYQVVKIGANGKRAPLATTSGVPFQLRTDRDGGVVFLDRTGKDRGTVKRVHAGKTSTLATGRLADVDLTSSATGTVFITGKATTRALPGTVKNPGVTKGATASTRGQAMIVSRWQDAKKPPQGDDALSARPVSTHIHTLATGSAPNLTTSPGDEPVSAARMPQGKDILASKWNQTRKTGMIVNDGKPKYIENWFFALWAYNSGFYPQSEAGNNGGKWGVGWTNNPANPLWKENCTPFLENSSGADDYSHAAHPQDWPYQEKVIGWAARPISDTSRRAGRQSRRTSCAPFATPTGTHGKP